MNLRHFRRLAVWTVFFGTLSVAGAFEEVAISPEQLSGSHPILEAPRPGGAMLMDILAPAEFTGPMSVHPWPNSPGVYEIPTSPLGHGGLVAIDEASGAYTGYFAFFGYAPIPVAFNFGKLRYEFNSFGIFGAFQSATISAVFPSTAPCPPVLRSGLQETKLPTPAGQLTVPALLAAFDTWQLPWLGCHPEWVQFFSMTVTYGGLDAGGNAHSASVPKPKNSPAKSGWPITGNGGGDPTKIDNETNKGLALGDGSRVYVDSVEGDGAYPVQSASGSVTAMADAPRPAPAIPGMVPLPPPWGGSVTWIRWRLDLWLYLMCDDQPIYSIIWYSEWEFAADGLTFNAGIAGEGPVTELPTNHSAALSQHRQNNFSGAPR